MPLALTERRSEIASKIQERIELGKELQRQSTQLQSDPTNYKNDARKWREYNFELLRQIFTNDSIAVEYRSSALPSRVEYDEESAFRNLRETVNHQITKLESIVDRLKLYQEPVAQRGSAAELTHPEDRSKIFVVHGHDEGAREAVGRFIQGLGFKPILLHERANEGRTVIEKVEAHADVGFAVVLLTPDDVGEGRNARSPSASKRRFGVGLFYWPSGSQSGVRA